MASKPKAVRPKARREKTQLERFAETAREVGAEYDEAAFARAFDKVVAPKPAVPSPAGAAKAPRRRGR